MERVFLSMSFRAEDQALVAAASAIIEGQDLRAITGRNLGGGSLTPEIQKLIDDCDALVALCTVRNDPPGSTSVWVRDELLYAVAKTKPTLSLVEAGVTLDDGMLKGKERADFTRAEPLGAFSKLATTLAIWRQNAGVVLRAAIVPAEIAVQLSKKQVVELEFCVIKDGTPTSWRSAPLVKEIGGLYAYLRGVPRGALVKVRTKIGRKRLESVAVAPHYYFTLEDSANG